MNVIYRALCFLLALCGSYGCSDSSDSPSGDNLLLMQAEADARLEYRKLEEAKRAMQIYELLKTLGK